jgi:ubiquinone biosynthesis protein
MEAIDLAGVVKEFARTIRKELDFHHEGASIVRFSHCFRDDPDMRVPHLYKQFTTRHLLVEEYMNGIKISDTDALRAAGHDLAGLATKAMRVVFDQIFTHGFFHADPHPGNIFVLENGALAFIDFGMMGSLRPAHLEFLSSYVLGYLSRDPRAMTEALLLVSGKRNFPRKAELEFQVSEMLAHYRYLSVQEMDFGKVLNESVDILVRFGLRIPGGIYLLVKALMGIERLAVILNPGIDFPGEMKPWAMQLAARRYDPKRFVEEIFSSIMDYYRLARELPGDLNEILTNLKEGRFKTQMEIRGLDPLTEQLDTSSSRISMAIVLAALIIGASIISQWEQTRWIGAIVFCLAGLVGFWLLVKLLRHVR